MGKDQAILIDTLLTQELEPSNYNKHKILCGDAANFQGDERDVIFLSMIDSSRSNGPLSLSIRNDHIQRYNVAVSRAKDQVWLIHSLDRSKDLKERDLRKNLLDYAYSYSNRNNMLNEAQQLADSPFEKAVSNYLIGKGYKIVAQWPVGAYRIDMVAIDGIKKVAIECDGERWHSGEEKIRADMERQTILERLGWQFIRIRGSEYYSNPEKAMNRVIERLTFLGVGPNSQVLEHQENTELVDTVIRKMTENNTDNNTNNQLETLF